MDLVDMQRRAWNKSLKVFRESLLSPDKFETALEMFVKQHGMLHAGSLTNNQFFSFEDEVFKDLTAEQSRRIPKNKEHSIAWCIWHIARIEDITMNILVAGQNQLFHDENWSDRLKIRFLHTGNDMGEKNVAEISATIDLDALRAYRMAVGGRTQHIVRQLDLEDLKMKVDPTRIQRLIDEEAVLEEARGLLDYWGKRTIAGLLLMPATRHNLVHLNECLMLKDRRA
jgi:hypothetical protein